MSEILLARCAVIMGLGISEPSFRPAISQAVDALPMPRRDEVKAAIELLNKEGERAGEIAAEIEKEGGEESEQMARMIRRILTEGAK